MKYITITLSLLLFSCSTMPTETVVPKPPLQVQKPEPLDMRKVEFEIVTLENALSIFAKMEEEGVEPVFFALSGTYYKNLSLNMEDIKNYIILQKKIIELYIEYYEIDIDSETKE